MLAMHLARGCLLTALLPLADLSGAVLICVVPVHFADWKSREVRRMPTVHSQHCMLHGLYPVNHCGVVGVSFHFRFLYALPALERSVQHYVSRELDFKGNILLQSELPVEPRMCQR